MQAKKQLKAKKLQNEMISGEVEQEKVRKSRGGSRILIWGARGDTKDYVRALVHCEGEFPYGRGPGLTKGPRSSRVLEALLCYLSLIFKHSDTKWNLKTVVDQKKKNCQ